MNPLLRISAWIDRANGLLGRGVSWLILITTLVCAYNAVVRKVFNISSNALLEVQWYLFGAVFLLGAAYTLQQNAHIRIDLLAGRWSPRTQALIEILGHLAFVLPLIAYVLFHGSLFFHNAWTIGEQSADVGGLPRWPAKGLIVLGFAALGLQVISELIKRFHVLLSPSNQHLGQKP